MNNQYHVLNQTLCCQSDMVRFEQLILRRFATRQKHPFLILGNFPAIHQKVLTGDFQGKFIKLITIKR